MDSFDHYYILHNYNIKEQYCRLYDWESPPFNIISTTA
jgi:hypothetical protein